MNSKVDKFLSKAEKWQEEMEHLRMISLDCGLTEALKWGNLVNSFQKNNIVIISHLKNPVHLCFSKGPC